jgi:23S rRNA (cytidine1920-2'-O)/16S rRNA (cytidine1409-2'-O)-methyltransferase
MAGGILTGRSAPKLRVGDGSVRCVPKVRLDSLLASRGLFPSRSRAAASVLAGEIRLGADRRRADKPGELVPADVSVAVDEAPRFVSRGGIKLANALAATGIEVRGQRCLDVGAATGGFTDCLLQQGAERVVAVDVAYGELHWRLRNDPRVTVFERLNARNLEPAKLPYAPDLIAIDVSFISLTKVLPAVLACAERYDCLALCKPQFEVGRRLVGKGGVVRSANDRRSALLSVAECARRNGAGVLGFIPSGLPGPKGNLETFVWLGDRGQSGVADLESAVREAGP